MLGGFNAIREVLERRGSSDVICRDEIGESDDFISESELIDLPLHVRKFTWSRIGDSAKIRIDKFLLSESWYNEWLTSKKLYLKKGFSDHCPILLGKFQKNWGLKPFWMLSCWKDIRLS